MAWVAVMKSGTIITAYCSYIAWYAILFGAMDCVSMYKCYVRMCVFIYIHCTYECSYVCIFMYICDQI